MPNREQVTRRGSEESGRSRTPFGEFLKSHMRENYATLLSTLDERHAIVFGRASPCTKRVLVRPNEASKSPGSSSSWTRFRSTNETESGETCSTTVKGDALAMVRLVETLEGLARVAPGCGRLGLTSTMATFSAHTASPPPPSRTPAGSRASSRHTSRVPRTTSARGPPA